MLVISSCQLDGLFCRHVKLFYTILVGTPVIKEPLSERVNDDFREIVEVMCRNKVGSGVELYVKSQKGRYASVCVCVTLLYLLQSIMASVVNIIRPQLNY